MFGGYISKRNAPIAPPPMQVRGRGDVTHSVIDSHLIYRKI